MSSLPTSAASCGLDAARLYIPPARPRLGAKQSELDLAARIKAGDQAAVHELALTAEGLITQFVRFYRRFCRTQTVRDLWQEGYLALLLAARAYDPETHNVRFSTFAYRGLRWRFWRAAYTKDHLVNPRRGKPLRRHPFDFDVQELPEEPDEWEHERELLPGLLARFPTRTQRLFELRTLGWTLEQVGKDIGVTKERVRQIEAKAIRRMREIISNGVSTNGE